jgi:hypothetical protein
MEKLLRSTIIPASAKQSDNCDSDQTVVYRLSPAVASILEKHGFINESYLTGFRNAMGRINSMDKKIP